MSAPRGRVALVHEHIPPDAPLDDLDTLATAARIADALARLGWDVSRVTFGTDLAVAEEALRDAHADLVFNLTEALGGRVRFGHVPPDLCAELGLPVTGAPGETYYVTTNKPLAKRIMAAADIPTPEWRSAARAGADGTWIVKPVAADASVGIEDHSVVAGAALGAALASARGEVFAERFVEGREFNLSILVGEDGPEVLPPAEIRFDDFPPDRPRIVSWRAKWDETSHEFAHTRRRFDLPLEDGPLVRRLSELALRCWDVFGLRGYARVDFRVDAEGRPWVLEVNANPCLAPDAGFIAAAAAAGLDYDAVIARIVAAALPPPSGALRLREHLLPTDGAEVRRVLESSGFFYAEEVDVAIELVDAARERGQEASGYHFLFAERGGRVVGYACYGPIACTKRRYDLFWIAAEGGERGAGVGSRLLAASEARIRARGGVRVYAETSSRPLYEPTRAFYDRRGYRRVAEVEGFYGPGDGKIVFEKVLGDDAG